MKEFTPIYQDLNNIAIGRDDEVKKLHETIQNSKQPIVIWGEGGIGKTTLAQKYIQDYQENIDNIIYIESGSFHSVDNSVIDKEVSYLINSFTENEILLYNLNFKKNIDDEVLLFKNILIEINKISGNNLLYIDSTGVAFEQLYNLFSTLSNWKILLTSRYKINRCILFNLGGLKLSESLSLFYTYYLVEKDDNQVKSLIELIDNHTLTIELIAKNFDFFSKRIHEILKEVTQHAFNFKNNIRVIAGRYPKAKTIQEHLISIFAIEYLEKESLEILKYFSVLPTIKNKGYKVREILNINYLPLYFGYMDNVEDLYNILNNLTKLGWIKKEIDTFYCHTVIQEAIKAQLKPNTENCSALFNLMLKILQIGINDYTKIEYTRLFTIIAESLLKNIVLNPNEIKETDNNLFYLNHYLGIFNRLICNYHKAIFYQEQAIKCNLALSDRNEMDLISVYIELSITYQILGESSLSLEIVKKSIDIAKKRFPDDKITLAKLYHNLGSIYRDLKSYTQSLKYFFLAIEIKEINCPSSETLAQSYNNIGHIYHLKKNYDKALDYYLLALNIRKSSEESILQIGESYNNIGQLYFEKGEIDKAHDFSKQSLSIWREFLPFNHPHLLAAEYNLKKILEKKDVFYSKGSIFNYDEHGDIREKYAWDVITVEGFEDVGKQLEQDIINEALRKLESESDENTEGGT